MKIQEKIKTIKPKNAFQVASGLFLIILTLILNGFLSFMQVGFNFNAITTAEYWANFGLMTASEIVVMYGAYLISKSKDTENKKLVDLKAELDKYREIVYTVDKVDDAEEWLREIYNYREKLLIYEKKVKQLYERLRAIKPQEYDTNFQKKMLKYENIIAKKQFLQKQLEFVKEDLKRLKMVVEKAPEEKISEIEKKLADDDYLFNTARIKYRDVYWGNLKSDMEQSKGKDDTVFFNEGKELSKNIIKMIGYACIVSAYIATMVFPAFIQVGWSYVIQLILTTITLLWFTIRGIMMSKKIILGKYYNALEKRKAVYTIMLKDLKISNVVIKGKENE